MVPLGRACADPRGDLGLRWTPHKIDPNSRLPVFRHPPGARADMASAGDPIYHARYHPSFNGVANMIAATEGLIHLLFMIMIFVEKQVMLAEENYGKECI